MMVKELVKESAMRTRKQRLVPHPHTSNLSIDVDTGETVTRKRKRESDDKNKEKSKLYTLRRAEALQSCLEPVTHTFIKYMLPSHVSSCFWLGLPPPFCRKYLPKEDAMMTLVDEYGREYVTKYLVDKPALSGGWRGFSIVHKLVEGDILVFHLVKATKMKVYIVRAHDLPEVDLALNPLAIDVHEEEDPRPLKKGKNDVGKGRKSTKGHGRKRKVGEHNARKGTKRTKKLSSKRQTSPSLPLLEANGQSSPKRRVPIYIDFKDVKNLNAFTIEVDGVNADSEISEYIRNKYIELCSSQNAYLHEHLLDSTPKLVAGIISETVNIADALKTCKLSTSLDVFQTWDKSLLSFELMGMNVGFLRSRLQKIVTIAHESNVEEDSQRLKVEQTHAEEEMDTFEVKLVELKETLKGLAEEIATLTRKTKEWKVKGKTPR